MLALWVTLLKEHSHALPATGICYCATVPDNTPCNITLDSGRVERRLRGVGSVALGIRVTFDGRQTAELTHRIQCAERVFWANRGTLINSNVSFIPKFKLLAEILWSVGLWASGTWHLTYKQLSNLRGFQQRLFWKMFRVKPQTEMLHETMIRLARKIKESKKLSGWIDIDLVQRQLVHEWAGHVARLPTWRPGCLTSRILEWRDRNWLDEITIKEGSQMHGRRLRVWRWEEQVSNKFGGDWRKTAKDKDAWNRLGPVYWETGASSRV